MSLSEARRRSEEGRQRSFEKEIYDVLTGNKMPGELKHVTYGQAAEFETEQEMREAITGQPEQRTLSEVEQKIVDDFFIQTARKIVPITILGEKARVVFRHMFGLVGDFHYGLDETGNVVVQDMRSGNFGILTGDVLCSFVAAYLTELQSCGKDEVKQIVPDLFKEAGLAG